MQAFKFLNIAGTNAFVANNSDIGLHESWNSRTFIVLQFESSGNTGGIAQVFNWVNGQTNSIGYVANNGKYGLYVAPTAQEAVVFLPFDTKDLGEGQIRTKFYIDDAPNCIVNDGEKGLILNPDTSIATEFHLYPYSS